jgi:hypothetical protein
MARGYTAGALALIASQAAPAYEHPLDTHSVRKAYFLGNRKDEKPAKFLAQYAERLPLPKTSPHVAEIGLLTPYAQVVLRASRASAATAPRTRSRIMRPSPI